MQPGSSSGAHLAGRFDPSRASRLRPDLPRYAHASPSDLAAKYDYTQGISAPPAATGIPPEVTGELPTPLSGRLSKDVADSMTAQFEPMIPPDKGYITTEPYSVPKPETTLLQDIDKGLETIGDYGVRGGKSKAIVLGERLDAGKAAVDAAKARNITDPNALGRIFNNAYQEAGPGYLAEYGPTAAAAYGLYEWSESGESDEEKRLREIKEEEEEAERAYKASYAIYGADPGKYYVNLGLPPATVAAQGGLAEYPRRDLLVEGRGTERSDDIPAMLSDGEFVMNSKSVRGADPSGRGNRYAGANNLYNMMRNFEMRT
jgi:hypothetical protein